ncbi:MAG: acyl-CoA/acyl-ACP dehydrogenase [Acidimicrobiales bacterium]|nr:acyl-CoA/acyl-ACP dehydrogenase [Acidimicrobiales bacterium]
MDFNLNEREQAVSDLANQILGDKVDHDRLKEIEAGDDWFAATEWTLLADAGLTGIALPEAHGGGGLGIIEAGLVCEAVGHHVAPVPMLPTTVAALAVAEFGDAATAAELLPGVCDGSRVLTVAMIEHLREDLAKPGLVAGDDGALTGTKSVVEFAQQATHAVVNAIGPDGVGLYLVELGGDGVSIEMGVSTRKEPVAELAFTDAPATLLATGEGPVRWLEARYLGLVCATQLGVVEGQLRLTASYASEREQFGRPIATFQAVTQRLADCFIQIEGLRLQTQSALWRIANEADPWEDLRIAKWFGSEGAHFVAHGAQHMHGGIGVDVDYPLHRFTLWNKHLEVTLGAGNQQLRTIGAALATEELPATPA